MNSIVDKNNSSIGSSSSSGSTIFKYGLRKDEEQNIEEYQDTINQIEDRILEYGGSYNDYDLDRIGLETGATKDMIEGFAFCQAGDLYLHGDGLRIKKDLNEAMKFFIKASEKGSTYALWRLAQLYKLSGDSFKSKEIIHQLAEMNPLNSLEMKHPFQENLGVIESCFQLGKMYEFGNEEEGIKIDLIKSIKYFEKAANSNHPEANYHLGSMFLNRSTIPKDTVKGLFYLKKSAELGFTKAMYDYATYIQTSNPIESDQWFKKAKEISNHLGEKISTQKPSQ